jgi:hypothetical protein
MSYDCDIRERLGKLGPEHRDIWWNLDAAKVHDQAADVFQRLEWDAFTFPIRGSLCDFEPINAGGAEPHSLIDRGLYVQ